MWKTRYGRILLQPSNHGGYMYMPKYGNPFGHREAWRAGDMSGNHHVCLSAGACSDLAWWCKSLEVWNGVSLMTAANKAVSDIILTSDASGSWECGTFWEKRWFKDTGKDCRCENQAVVAVLKSVDQAKRQLSDTFRLRQVCRSQMWQKCLSSP